MKLAQVAVENCKSYREREAIALDDSFNILVGPNGGGKSNTLDIITIALRRFFLQEYVVHNREENYTLFRDIEATQPFHEIRRFLEPNLDRRNEPVTISLSLVVGESDLGNLETLRANQGALRNAATAFRNTPFRDLRILDELADFRPSLGEVLRYDIVDRQLNTGEDRSLSQFQKYLSSINFFLLLASEIGLEGLAPSFTYFSPYRSAGAQDLRGNLSGESFRSQLASHANSSSHAATSLLKLATLFFGEFRRSLESRARDNGFAAAWHKDGVVRSVTRYLAQLGYGWDVDVVDRNRNIYEIKLQRAGRVFSIEQASSGEKEILTFILGIFALQTSGGLVVIDEPEVHLHPRWQATLRDLLQELAKDTSNQIVLSTHSPVFITPGTIRHVRRVYRSDAGSTRVIGGARARNAAATDRSNEWHLLNSHNNEKVFFADRVVLVEGIQDRIVFDAILKVLAAAAEIREVVEVVEVHGKGNFPSYRELLAELGVPHILIADRDYSFDVGPREVRTLFSVEHKSVDRNVLNNKRSQDRVALSGLLEKAIEAGSTDGLRRIWEHIKGRHRGLRADLSAGDVLTLQEFLAAQRASGVHILAKGEIEDYLPLDAQSLMGTIDLVRPDTFHEWLATTVDSESTQELLTICLDAMQVSPKNRAAVVRKAVADVGKRELGSVGSSDAGKQSVVVERGD